MRLKIRKLGPITDSEIELGDVTMFLGPPNTGKSYTLRAIYTKLFPLDYYALKFMKEKLSERLIVYLERVFPEQSSNMFRDLFKNIVKIVLDAALLLDRDDARDRFEKLFYVLMERARLKGTLEWREDFLIASIKAPLISTALDASLPKKAVQESFYDFISELIPVEDVDSVIFEPTELSRIDISFIEEVSEHEAPMSARRLILLLEELFDFIELYMTRDLYRGDHYEGVVPLPRERSLRYMLDYFNIVLNARISVKPNIDRLEFSSAIVLKLRLHTRPPVPKERLPPSIRLEDIDRVVDNVFEKARTHPRLGRSIARIIDYTRSMVVKIIADSLSETILYDSLRGTFRSRLGLKDLRFVPFGRSMLVLGLESASREPFSRSRFLHRFIRDFYSSALASYVYWASKGRSRLLEGRLSERQARLLKAVTPLLEGKLSTDAAGRLLYRDWRGSLVDFQTSSALVEEVSGLVFALLSIDDNAIVLVEEPEAQLHPGAQIVMALFLASLPSLCGCRVTASTHSDLLAITLSQLAVQKPSKEWIKELLEKLLEKLLENLTGDLSSYMKEGIDILAEAVAEATENLNLKVYEFTREGRVKPIDPGDVLGKEVPGISKVIDNLTDWAFRLASYRASREVK